MDLIADIGGTKTRCALVGEDHMPTHIEVHNNSAFESLTAALAAYLRAHDAQAKTAAVAVAAPITGDSVRMTNRQWHFSIEEMRQDLGLERLHIINDFTAVALSIPRLQAGDVVKIGPGQAVDRKTLAVLGPGTGLGVSGLIRGRTGWAPLAGEGGHATLATVTAREAEVAVAVTRRYGHCSTERLISGPGLALLYNTLRELSGATALQIEPADVAQRADEGDTLADESLSMFFALLGSFAGNVALTLGAVGGVYIAGGVAPALLDRMLVSEFRARFEAKGRYAGFMQAIPTSVIVNPTPALLGLTSLL